MSSFRSDPSPQLRRNYRRLVNCSRKKTPRSEDGLTFFLGLGLNTYVRLSLLGGAPLQRPGPLLVVALRVEAFSRRFLLSAATVQDSSVFFPNSIKVCAPPKLLQFHVSCIKICRFFWSAALFKESLNVFPQTMDDLMDNRSAYFALGQEMQEGRLMRFPDIYKDKSHSCTAAISGLRRAMAAWLARSPPMPGASSFLSFHPTANGSPSPHSTTAISNSPCTGWTANGSSKTKACSRKLS